MSEVHGHREHCEHSRPPLIVRAAGPVSQKVENQQVPALTALQARLVVECLCTELFPLCAVQQLMSEWIQSAP